MLEDKRQNNIKCVTVLQSTDCTVFYMYSITIKPSLSLSGHSPFLSFPHTHNADAFKNLVPRSVRVHTFNLSVLMILRQFSA